MLDNIRTCEFGRAKGGRSPLGVESGRTANGDLSRSSRKPTTEGLDKQGNARRAHPRCDTADPLEGLEMDLITASRGALVSTGSARRPGHRRRISRPARPFYPTGAAHQSSPEPSSVVAPPNCILCCSWCAMEGVSGPSTALPFRATQANNEAQITSTTDALQSTLAQAHARAQQPSRTINRTRTMHRSRVSALTLLALAILAVFACAGPLTLSDAAAVKRERRSNVPEAAPATDSNGSGSNGKQQRQPAVVVGKRPVREADAAAASTRTGLPVSGTMPAGATKTASVAGATGAALHHQADPNAMMDLLSVVVNEELTDECKSALTGPASVQVVESCGLKDFINSGPDEHLEFPHLDPTTYSSELSLSRTCSEFSGCLNSLEDFYQSSVDACGDQVIFDFSNITTTLGKGINPWTSAPIAGVPETLDDDYDAPKEPGHRAASIPLPLALLMHLPIVPQLAKVKLNIADVHSIGRFALAAACATDREGNLCVKQLVNKVLPGYFDESDMAITPKNQSEFSLDASPRVTEPVQEQEKPERPSFSDLISRLMPTRPFDLLDLLSNSDLLCSECFRVEMAVLASHSGEQILDVPARSFLETAYRATRSACPGSGMDPDLVVVQHAIGSDDKGNVDRKKIRRPAPAQQPMGPRRGSGDSSTGGVLGWIWNMLRR